MSVIGVGAALMFRPPSTAGPLRLTATFDSGDGGRSDPILTSGVPGSGDFLYVRFVATDSAVFGYDSWSFGGPVSKPVKLQPGVEHRLLIDAPMLTQTDRCVTGNSQLRVVCDGKVVLDEEVAYHVRSPDRIYLGMNPIGGSSCGPVFHGSLKSEDGLLHQGEPHSGSSKTLRLVDWWLATLPRIFLLPLALAGGILGAERLIRWSKGKRPSVIEGAARGIRAHLWFAVAAVAFAGIFAYFVTGGDFDFDYPDSFGTFFDYQGASLLRGRLDVPLQAVGSEAFVYHGKTYGYFGPTPALMRLPFAVLNLAFGKLSRTLMLLDYLGCLVFAYLILRLAVRMLRGAEAVPSRGSVLLLVANAGIGSTLLFVSSRAYIYHEAILAASAFALACCYFTLRLLEAPDRRSWLPAWVCGVLAVQARPSPGLFALAFLGFGALCLLVRAIRIHDSPESARRLAGRSILAGSFCCLGVLSFNFVTYLKFGSFESLPLRYNVQFSAERLARFDGKNFHLSNIGVNTDGYVFGTHFVFRRSFPYFYALAPRMADHPGARIDAIENTVAIPFAMPGLLVMAVAGSALAFVRAPRLRSSLAVTWAAVVPLCLALFTAVAMSHRYTADFCPFLIVASSLGLAAFDRAVPAILRAAVWLLTLWSVFATLALTFEYQGEVVWGVPPETTAHFQRLRASFDSFFDHDPIAPSR